MAKSSATAAWAAADWPTVLASEARAHFRSAKPLLPTVSTFVDKVSDLGVDVLFPAIALSLIMFIGALLEMYYAYCTYDAYAGEKKRLAESHIA